MCAQLLTDFNTEYEDVVPPAGWLAERLAMLVAGTDTEILLVVEGGSARGITVLRFREQLWQPASECYLAELYIRPADRGRGLGRTLLTHAMHYAKSRGCTYMDLATTSADEAAVALYESVGFDRHEHSGDAVTAYYFERDL